MRPVGRVGAAPVRGVRTARCSRVGRWDAGRWRDMGCHRCWWCEVGFVDALVRRGVWFRLLSWRLGVRDFLTPPPFYRLAPPPRGWSSGGLPEAPGILRARSSTARRVVGQWRLLLSRSSASKPYSGRSLVRAVRTGLIQTARWRAPTPYHPPHHPVVVARRERPRLGGFWRP